MFSPSRFPAFVQTCPVKSLRWLRLFTSTPSQRNGGRPEMPPSKNREKGDGASAKATNTTDKSSRLRFDPERISLEHADLLKIFGLAEVPESNNTGAIIDKLGRITITSEEASQQKHTTALVLYRAPACLDERDFMSVLGQGKFLNQWRNTRGLERIIPLRFPDTLRRSNTWILIFYSPAAAKEFQDKVYRLFEFARDNLPTSTMSSITPPPNYTADIAGDYRLSDYTLTSPWLKLSLAAYLAPFDQKIQGAIDLHNRLVSRHGKQGFPVRIWIDNQSHFTLKQEDLRRLLLWDGQNRWSPWQIVEEDPITPLTEPLSNEMLSSGEEELTEGDCWRVAFQTAAEARRFVRAWHRSVFPKLDGLPFYPDPPPLIKAECLFESEIC
ncbi:hypothetical protein RJZ56_001774 [Blastomyces dermatitidis]|uniref:Uncharacterized protein n=1 Tax=Ajellomyces dermatitidis (strain ATCC 18188 / CBS 674.68) TaxID=653446 RepID=F2TPZ4_AJEDA|nr:hypothetical protein BDDG_08220 [Blastomyces dermatitidis ATCC 18188]EQL30979.1 hypothetical protein BDFG_06612 [Blastomyces dermatitidis ATCC 26199]